MASFSLLYNCQPRSFFPSTRYDLVNKKNTNNLPRIIRHWHVEVICYTNSILNTPVFSTPVVVLSS